MKTFIVVDFYNLVFRAKHVTTSDVDSQVGMAMHIFFTALKSAHDRFKADHIVICSDSGSWRYNAYADYKLNRKLKELKKTPKEVEQDKVFFECMGNLWEFLRDKTNMTTLKCQSAEADDLIALWVQSHPDDRNIIMSTDEDYVQLLKPNVEQYNGVKDMHVTIDGYWDKDGDLMVHKDGTTKPDPEFNLFLKCIRGDSDNIFSAFPGARLKSSKKKVGIVEAYEDRHTKGFAYNNFFNQTWKDHNDNDVIVKEKFEFNKMLMDLTAQPEHIKVACLTHIFEETSREHSTDIGFNFMKFCGQWDLVNISKNPTPIASVLNKRY